MQGNILRVRDLGYEDFWRVLHEATPASPLSSTSTPLPEYPPTRQHALLLRSCAESSPASWVESSVLCHAALARVGGTVQSLELPPELASSLPLAAQGPLYQAGAHFCLAHGFPQKTLDVLSTSCALPLYNMGNASHHPCAALADLALLRQQDPTLENTRIAWVGGVNGLAHSLMEAAIYAPFELFMAVPTWGEPEHDIAALALKAGARIFLTREIHMALDGARYVYAGAGPQNAAPAPLAPSADPASTGMAFNPFGDNAEALETGLPLTAELLAHASPGARVLTGQSLGCGCRVDSSLPDEELERQRPGLRLRVLLSLLGHACV